MIRRALLLVPSGVFLLSVAAWSQDASELFPPATAEAPGPLVDVESCMASALNRTAAFRPGFPFRIGNVPSVNALYRVRVVCETPEGTITGQSEFLQAMPGDITGAGRIEYSVEEPIPVSLQVDSATRLLAEASPTVQLVTVGTFPDGSTADLTVAQTGTFYSSSNPGVATISPDGLVSAVSSGRVLITAINEGVMGSISLEVQLAADADGDGLPDDYEDRNAVDPGGRNLARLPGVAVASSQIIAGNPPELAVDGDRRTSWLTSETNEEGGTPFYEVTLPADASVAQLRIVGNRPELRGADVTAAFVRALNAAGAEIVTSAEMTFPAPDHNGSIPLGVAGVRTLRLVPTDEEDSDEAGFAEIQVISAAGGPGLDRNDPSDAAEDFDLDGLTNLDEFSLGTSPFSEDTDGDFLDDGEESALGADPVLADTDGDGLVDGDEREPTTDTDGDGLPNILDPDSDGDGLPDGLEIRLLLSPLVADSDGDGLPDTQEDSDGDGLLNIDELDLFTDPANPDTDGDGLLDGEEVLLGEDPLVPDDEAPTVRLVSPAAGPALVESETLVLGADADDNGRVAAVDFRVNGVVVGVDDTVPYELTFTTPYAATELDFAAVARDTAGNETVSSEVRRAVTPDPLTTVAGSVVAEGGEPVAGADVTAEVRGLTAEFFGFPAPLTSFPDLAGLAPDMVRIVPLLNFRNPESALSLDTFGTSLGPDVAARFRGRLRVDRSGFQIFVLGFVGGVRLRIDGTLVRESISADEFLEVPGFVTLSGGEHDIELEYFQGAAGAELTLSWFPQGDAQVVPTSVLTPASDVFAGITDAGGLFAIPGVPTVHGDLEVTASANVSGDPFFGRSAQVPPVPGGISDVGQIVLRPGPPPPPTDASFFTDADPSVIFAGPEVILRKELSGFSNYGQLDGRADVLFTGEAATWTFDLTGVVDPATVQRAFFVVSVVADDHSAVDPGLYSMTVWTNEQPVFTGAAGVPHGSPFGSRFTNWVEREYEASVEPASYSFSLHNTSSASGGDWLGVDWIELHLETF